MKPGETKSILFVGAAHAGASLVLDALRAGGSDPVIAGDVYLALARWGNGAVDPAAVIVCVDLLQPTEFEFFKLAARDHGQIPIYVCARPEASAKVDRAIAAGARGRIAPEDALELLCELVNVEHGAQASAAQPSAFDPIEIADPLTTADRLPSIAPLLDPAEDDPGSNGDAAYESGDQTAGSARVPWKTYANRPVRKPPVRPGAAPPSPQPAADPFDGPLLSAQELEALMREDFRTLPTDAAGGREGLL